MGHHHRKHKYTFHQFTTDISRLFITAEKEVAGVYHHGLDTLGKLGGSLGTPLLIIVGAGVIFVVLNRGALK